MIQIGDRFNRLVVVAEAEKSPRGRRRWLCQCDCGKTTTVLEYNLKNGTTKSCGCLQSEVRSSSHRKHGETHSKLYYVWRSMKNRCDNPNVPTYKYYGGKGVRVCQQWEVSYETFRDWAISSGYAPGLEIDRIDPDGDYTPENCQWLSHQDNISKMHSDNAQRSGRKYVGVSPCGVEVEFTNTARFASEHGLCRSSIRKAVKSGKPYKGWEFHAA